MLPGSWKPLNLTAMVRLGDANDGGYVLPAEAVDATKMLISMGLNDDWSFESDFSVRTGGRVICFDHTVTRRFWRDRTLRHLMRGRWSQALKLREYRSFFNSDNAIHFQTKVGYDQPGSISLKSILATYAPTEKIGLKVDIEGWEYRILDQIVGARHRVNFVVIELHDIDLHEERISKFLAGMTGFEVAWLHANNFGGADSNGDPLVVEMTLVESGFAPHDLQRGRPFGGAVSLTTPNDPDSPELQLRFSE